MNVTSRILGESVRPPTQKELVDPKSAYEYAVDVVGSRWPAGESVIAKDPYWSCYYAIFVIKGRWSEGERRIMTNPLWAYCYAVDVIQGRWPEAEATIAGDPECSRRYLQAYPDAREDWILNGWLDWLDT